MTVRIIIDRKVRKGKEEEFFDLVKELRSKAMFVGKTDAFIMTHCREESVP